MNNFTRIQLPIIAALLFLASQSFFILNQWELGVRFQFGRIVESHTEPGLHFKIPFIQNVRKYDARIQTLETQPERFLTREKKNLIVDTFVKWRVVDPAIFYQRVAGSPQVFNSRLDPIVKDKFRAEFGKRDLQDVVAGYSKERSRTVRSDIQEVILADIKQEGLRSGIEILDVRIKGVELPRDVRQSVYQRMEKERERVAKELRAKGQASYIEIVSEADRTRAVMMAKAYESAEMIRGEGDASATRIYAEAYNKNPEFYAFYRSLEAYRNSFNSQNDLLILDPDTEFFKYFHQVQ